MNHGISGVPISSVIFLSGLMPGIMDILKLCVSTKLRSWMKLVPSCNLTVCYGKSPSIVGKSTITGPFSIAILNYHRVYNKRLQIRVTWWLSPKYHPQCFKGFLVWFTAFQSLPSTRSQLLLVEKGFDNLIRFIHRTYGLPPKRSM